MTDDRRVGDGIKMNSYELRRAFHATYRSFFNTHDIVISGNNILTWGSDISHDINVLWIKQKLPIHTLCGANFNTSGRVTFGVTHQYSPLENAFTTGPFTAFPSHELDQITGFFEDFLAQHDCPIGMEIDLLFEAPPWHGFSLYSVLSVLLGTLLCSAIGCLDEKTFTTGEIRTDSPTFDTVYALSLEVLQCISHGKGIGSSNYAVMIPDNPLPILYFSEKSVPNYRVIDPKKVSGHTKNDAIYKDTLLNFLHIDPGEKPELPLDYGLIFTGTEYRFSEIELTRESAKHEKERLDEFMIRTIGSLPIEDEARTNLERLLGFGKDEGGHQDMDNINFRILEGFDYLFHHPHNEGAINMFIDMIHKVGLSSFSCQRGSKFPSALQYLFYKYRQFEDEEIGIVPFNTGRIGGSLFFVTKSGKSRATIQRVIDHLKVEWHVVSLDYASYRDGYAASGVRIEQFITRKRYSEYTRDGSILFSDSSGTVYCGDYDTIVEQEKDCILLDTIRSRIYIRWVRLTSKDIHSQNTTIDMMKILIENIGKDVPNTKLPVSTYSQNKNELLGKVIIPIKKLSKEYYGQEIPLVCSGGIADYYLRLDRTDDIRIGVIKKLQY